MKVNCPICREQVILDGTPFVTELTGTCKKCHIEITASIKAATLPSGKEKMKWKVTPQNTATP